MPHISNNKVGHFMVAVGMVIEQAESGMILVQKRASEYQKDQWEIPYGRVDQAEELFDAVRREANEETGLTDLTPRHLLRVWHFFRGEKTHENELYGLTFHCQTTQHEIAISSEHSQQQWVTLDEAIERVTLPGIKHDLVLFREWRDKNWQNHQISFGGIGNPEITRL